MFDIEAIDKEIKKELKLLCEVIETFLKNPEPPTWVPPNYVMPSNHKYLTNLRIPSYRNGNPSLLLHNLDVCGGNEIEELFGHGECLCICNTSGSGKTWHIMEGLTKYWGFYLVAIPDANGVGIRDLQDALEGITDYQEWMSDLSDLPSGQWLWKVLAARVVIFQLFLQLTIVVDGKLQEKHKRIWLLFQLSDQLYRGGILHPFVHIIKNGHSGPSSFEWDRLKLDSTTLQEAAQIVQSHLTKGKSLTFGPVTTRLVEYGIARLRNHHKGQIVEPLAFLSLMKWLQTLDHGNLEANIRSRLALQASRGDGCEELVILYLLRMLRYPVLLSMIFNFCNPPVWANNMVQIVGRLDGIDVAVDILGGAPQNPGLGVVHYAADIEEVICWLENPAVAPAVLITTHLFGPDVIIRCSSPLSNSTIASRNILVMGQLKSYTGGNKESLDARMITEALTSLNRVHWFKQTPLHQRQKLINAIEKYCVLCFVGGYPLPPNLNLSAISVSQAIDALGPNIALASINLDTFKAHFISEDEARNVLAPLEDALTHK
ncbi:hypothetical protein L208DRAFT_1461528 [Tricholoma matsutake]|nr:hypothetical protein L208DRAFT_1461528 [Tricholoma matsutake 945]